jgi:hypothetical protein
MSMEADRDWIESHGLWIDVIRLTCDLCGAKSPWAEPTPQDFAAWSHLLGLDCCGDCSADFYLSPNR